MILPAAAPPLVGSQGVHEDAAQAAPVDPVAFRPFLIGNSGGDLEDAAGGPAVVGEQEADVIGSHRISSGGRSRGPKQ